jgi:SSS family solute:Na+ symporter
MVLLIIVSLGLTITGIVQVGGVTNVYEAVPAEFWILFRPNSDVNYPWLPIVLGYPVMAIWFYCTDQSMVQSVLAAKNLKQGQFGVNMIGWLKIIDMPLFILPGIICFILFPDLAAPEEAYATMVTNLMPVGIIGLVMAVLIAALVSTIDSSLNSLSTIFTLDIFVRRFRPNASQKEIIRIGRIVALIAAVLGVFIALGISSIQIDDLYIMLQSILAFLAPPMSVVFLIGILWKKATPAAANVVLSLGSVISIGIGVCSLWNIPNKEFWPHPLLLSFFVFVGLMALAILVSLATMKNYKGSNLPRLKEIWSENESNLSIWFLWGALGILTIALYIFFN